ncbi:UNVERIFIED_CONTAM: Transcription factor [Sesamum radiatum]|uniref:Transcription factor n=1 Tax=Sesamum radiatum TaxID=300843 RepID=A0AAW2T4R1_SESRA
MASEEFQGGVCGGNWWNPSRNLFGSPCSLPTNDIGSFGWPNYDLIMDMKAPRSNDESVGSAADGRKPQQESDANGSMSVDSTLQMMGISLSSSTTPDDWNQDFLHDSGRSDGNYTNILQDSSMNYRQETRVDYPQIHKNWSSRNFSEDASVNSFKQANQSFPLEHHQQLNSITSSSDCVTTCQGLSAGFPLNSTSYSYTSSLLQTLFDTDSQPQQSLLDNQAMNYSSAATHTVNSDQFLASLVKAPPTEDPSFTRQQPSNHLPITNNAPLWKATAGLSTVPTSFLPSAHSGQFLPSSLNIKKPNLPSFNQKHQNGEARDLASLAKKAGNEPATFKRPRIETPSPLPTFKVRKEKLGDRITALQQLVSPFGKTDTASVLHEAIEYIKFLHDQVSVLSTPYLKNGSPPLQRQQAAEHSRVNKDQQGLLQDLKSRGLCLVPISSTFPVASETTSDFWTPTFGGNFK